MSSVADERMTAEEEAHVGRVTRGAVRLFVGLLLQTMHEVGASDAPWPAKWLALRLAAQQLLEAREASDDPGDIVGVEVARAVLGLMRRLERETTDGAARWNGLTRFLRRVGDQEARDGEGAA